MVKWLRHLMLAAVLVGVAPTPAWAQFWDVVKFLNDMSGPQMIGWVYEAALICGYAPPGGRAESVGTSPFLQCLPYRSLEPNVEVRSSKIGVARRRWTLVARGGRFVNEKHFGENEDVDVPGVSMNLFGVGYARSYYPVLREWTPKIELGGSFDMVHFRGPTVTNFWVPTIDGIVTVHPFAADTSRGSDPPSATTRSRFGDAVGISLRVKQFLESFDASRFGVPAEVFRSDTEAIYQLQLSFDFYAFMWR